MSEKKRAFMNFAPPEVFAEAVKAMREAAKPGTCAICKQTDVPCVTLTREGGDATMTACLGCMTGENAEPLKYELN